MTNFGHEALFVRDVRDSQPDFLLQESLQCIERAWPLAASTLRLPSGRVIWPTPRARRCYRVAWSLEPEEVRLSPDAGLGKDLVSAYEPDSLAVEHLRSLRAQLMLRWFENDSNPAALAIMSPGSGEGRSYITANPAVLDREHQTLTTSALSSQPIPESHALYRLIHNHEAAGDNSA